MGRGNIPGLWQDFSSVRPTQEIKISRLTGDESNCLQLPATPRLVKPTRLPNILNSVVYSQTPSHDFHFMQCASYYN